MEKRASFRKTELDRAIKVCRENGLKVKGVEVEGGGFALLTVEDEDEGGNPQRALNDWRSKS